MSASLAQMSPAVLGSPIDLPVFLKAVRAGFPSAADDYLDAPIDLSRTLIQNAPATFIMTVAGNSAVDVGIFDGSLITVDRSLVPRDGDAGVGHEVRHEVAALHDADRRGSGGGGAA